MVTLHDAPTDELIEALAEELADDVEEPDWAQFAKSGDGRELPPEQDDFWQRRAASILRRIATDGPVGVDRLSSYYGSKKRGSTRYRVAPASSTRGSKKMIRTILQQLEAAGYVETTKSASGRRITPEGQSLLDTTAGDVLKDLDRPELEKYV
jgi:small subunit ribosomal protein S19e